MYLTGLFPRFHGIFFGVMDILYQAGYLFYDTLQGKNLCYVFHQIIPMGLKIVPRESLQLNIVTSIVKA